MWKDLRVLGLITFFFLLSAVPILLQGGNYLVSVLCLLFFAMIILRYLHLSGREQILLESYIQSCCRLIKGVKSSIPYGTILIQLEHFNV